MHRRVLRALSISPARPPLLLIVALAIGLVANWPMVSIAGAHANLLAASPAVGQPAGGVIDRVQLVFDEPISELVSTIEGPDGEVVATTIDAVTQQQFDLRFDPLEIEGIYRVGYAFLSIDGDTVELGHAFEFDRTAPAPLAINGPTLIARSESRWQQGVALGALLVVVLALGERLRRRRRALAQLVS